MSVHIRASAELEDGRAVKLGSPAGEAADWVLPEWFAEAPPAWTAPDGERWYELDSASCRQRATEAAQRATPNERWEASEWRAALLQGWGEVAEALERVEKETRQSPLVCISY